MVVTATSASRLLSTSSRGYQEHHRQNFDKSQDNDQKSFATPDTAQDRSWEFERDDDFYDRAREVDRRDNFDDRRRSRPSRNQGRFDDYDDRRSRPSRDQGRFDDYADRRSARNHDGFDRYDTGNFGGLDFGDNLEKIDWADVEEFESNVYDSNNAMSEAEADEFRRQNDITIIHNAENCPAPISGFDQVNFPEGVDAFLRGAGFEGPMPIQAQGWPIAMTGRDLIAIGQTGSGKTLGFLLPAIAHIMGAKKRNPDSRDPVALVVAPTRELAQQTEAVFLKIKKHLGSKLYSVCLFGGSQRDRQCQALRMGVDLVIATPGRLIDLLSSREVSLAKTTYLVLDEADRMLDMGFEPQIKKILSQIRPDRQMSMWSATWPREVESLAFTLLRSAENSKRGQHVHLNIGSSELQANRDITQLFEFVDRDFDKQDKLVQLLEQLQREAREDDSKLFRVLVFCKTKRSADYVEQALSRDRLRADSIHGDKSQRMRDRALQDFRTGRTNILVATDVAARGLDVDDIACVINYDIPNNIEDYIHRIGRTGRRGRAGTAVSFMTTSSDDTARFAKPLSKVLMQAEQEVPDQLLDIMKRGPRGGGRPRSNSYSQSRFSRSGGAHSHRETAGRYNREFVYRRNSFSGDRHGDDRQSGGRRDLNTKLDD